MLNSLITSQTRIKLLRKFFLNSSTRSHLRGLEAEFGESSNGIRIELNRFEKAGLLSSTMEGNKKLYQANREHPLYSDIHNIILKDTGIDKVVENVIYRIGNLLSVYLTGDFACGRDGKFIDLILVGTEINIDYLNEKVGQAKKIVGREIGYKIYHPVEAELELANYNPSEILPLWFREKPERVKK